MERKGEEACGEVRGRSWRDVISEVGERPVMDVQGEGEVALMFNLEEVEFEGE